MNKHDLEYFILIISRSNISSDFNNLANLSIYDRISDHSLFDQGEKNMIFTGIHIDVCTYTPFINNSLKVHHKKCLNR